MKTIFIDIDGCILRHKGDMSIQVLDQDPELLPGVLDKFIEWDRAGYKIILTTGRRESLRSMTENTLKWLGIFYDQLIMGLPRGERIIINDKKPNATDSTAKGISIDRNIGLIDIHV